MFRPVCATVSMLAIIITSCVIPDSLELSADFLTVYRCNSRVLDYPLDFKRSDCVCKRFQRTHLCLTNVTITVHPCVHACEFRQERGSYANGPLVHERHWRWLWVGPCEECWKYRPERERESAILGSIMFTHLHFEERIWRQYLIAVIVTGVYRSCFEAWIIFRLSCVGPCFIAAVEKYNSLNATS